MIKLEVKEVFTTTIAIMFGYYSVKFFADALGDLELIMSNHINTTNNWSHFYVLFGMLHSVEFLISLGLGILVVKYLSKLTK